jgi:hypothetical protein
LLRFETNRYCPLETPNKKQPIHPPCERRWRLFVPGAWLFIALFFAERCIVHSVNKYDVGGRRPTVPSPSPPYDSEYWKKRAEEARTLAEGMADAQTKILMLGIAESYEQIAKSYESLAKWQERPHGP